ncbi:LLM class F420-dependent oxidoreductase [Streptomyces sp. NPDC085529]|uniref:LLM class F420-dependent oxidoreductase n=1 Tax=Streptomyces sp. NPDC085529 TaxID=3365729 RepID=UPI0037D0AC9F
MTLGVTLGSTSRQLPLDDTVRLAREARDAGVHSAWFGQSFAYDSPMLAALVGREVPGLHVGTAALPVFGRHPLLVSSQAQTAQAATGGRYHLGLALGTRHLTETAFGLPYQRPIGLLREFLTALRPLLDSGEADFHGELLTATTPYPAAVPGARPPVPVLVAAMGPQALRVSGELADGILPFLAGPRALGEHIVPAVTAAAEAAGRPAPRIVALVPGVVTADPEGLRPRAAEALSLYERIPSYRRVLDLSGADRAADLAVLGDEETIAAEVRRYHEAGATEVIFTATDLGGEDARSRTWKLLGALSGASG